MNFTAAGEEQAITEQRKDPDSASQEGPGPNVSGAPAPVEGAAVDDPWEGFTLDDSVFRSGGGQDRR